MSDNLNALHAAIDALAAKVAALVAKPPVVVSDGVDAALPAAVEKVNAMAAQVDAAMAPPAS